MFETAIVALVVSALLLTLGSAAGLWPEPADVGSEGVAVMGMRGGIFRRERTREQNLARL